LRLRILDGPFRFHQAARLRNPQRVVGILRAPALTVAAGVTEAAVLHLRSLIARPRLANKEFRQADRKLDDLCAALVQTETPSEMVPSDAAILASLPGIGKTTLATLLTEAPGPLTGRDYKALRTLSGVAPVTKRSGKSCVVVMRYAAHPRLREAVFHWARVAVQNDPKCKSRYEALRERGHSYGRALRSVADRMLGVACVLLEWRELFDSQHGMTTATA
jgi:transposase